MLIRSNERLFGTGKNGTGKSYWIQHQLDKLTSFLIYDPKHDDLYDQVDAVLVTNSDELQQAWAAGKKRVVYRPFEITDEEFNLICKLIYYKGNMVLIIDEMAFHVSSSSITKWHSICMRLGRKKGVGVWNWTQRTRTCLHNTILSETDHIVCFKLMLKTDRQKLAESFDPLFMDAWLQCEHSCYKLNSISCHNMGNHNSLPCHFLWSHSYSHLHTIIPNTMISSTMSHHK